MSDSKSLTFYHCPNTRSSGVLTLLELLEADYDLQLLSFDKGDHKSKRFVAINPMGKVPAIVYKGEVVTEQVAIYLFLADLYLDKGFAPKLDDPKRGPYLRWMAYYGSCFEPAIIDRSSKHTHPSPSACPYGDFDTVVKTVQNQLSQHPYIAGDEFTAADVLWGSALGWILSFGLLPESEEISNYVKRVTDKPCFASSNAKDQEYAAQIK